MSILHLLLVTQHLAAGGARERVEGMDRLSQARECDLDSLTSLKNQLV